MLGQFVALIRSGFACINTVQLEELIHCQMSVSRESPGYFVLPRRKRELVASH